MSSVFPVDSSENSPHGRPRQVGDHALVISAAAGRNAWTAEIFLVAIFMIALTARVLVLAHPADLQIGPGILFDHLGLRIAVGHGFGPTSILPPLYPYYLSFFYQTIGYSHQIVLFSHALLGALACSAGALLVRYLGLNRRYAWLAGLLLALYPQSIAQARHFAPEILITYLFLVGMVLWIRGKPFPHYGETFGAGLLFGLVLLGGIGAVIPISFALVARARFEDRLTGTFGLPGPFSELPRKTGGIRLAHLALVATCLLIIGGAWAHRNSEVHGRAVLIDSTWALRLRAATIPGTHNIEYRVPGRRVVRPDNSPVTENAIALGDWMGFVATYPGKAVKIWSQRGREFFGFSGRNDIAMFNQFPYAGGFFQLAQALVWGIALSFALAWSVLLRGRGGQERVLAFTVVGCIILACLSGNVGNARILAFPLVIALAMRGAWGFLVLSGIRLRTPEKEALMLANGERVGLERLPVGVDPVGKLRWLAWLLGLAGIWLHGLLSILM